MNEADLIGRRGVSLRRLAQGEAFGAALTEIEELTSDKDGVAVRSLAAQLQDRIALNLVGSKEIKLRVGLAHLSGRMAVGHILEAVPSLTSPQKGSRAVIFDTARVTRNREKIHFIKLYAGEDSRPRAERGLILEALADLVPEMTLEWHNYVPSITCIGIGPQVPKSEVESLAAHVRSLLPLPVDLTRAFTTPKPPVDQPLPPLIGI